MLAAAALSALLPAAACLAGGHAVEARLDPRVELASIDQLVCGPAAPPDFRVYPIAYVDEARKRFASWRGQPACALLAGVAAAPQADRNQLMVRLGPPPELAERLTVENDLLARLGGRAAVDAWLAALRDAARRSDFASQLRALGPLLEPDVEAFRRQEARIGYVAAIEDYAGLPLDGRYVVSLSPFTSEGGSANNIAALPDGSVDVESVIGPSGAQDGRLTFWGRRVPGVLWHEAGHGVFDLLADLYEERIRQSQGLAGQEPYRSCYGGQFKQCFREQIVRAVMIRLIARRISPEAAREQLAFERPERFPQLVAIVEALKRYEAQRRRYPTLADFYPQLLATLPLPPGTQAHDAPRLPQAASLSPADRKRLRRLLAVLARKAADPRLRALERDEPAWQTASVALDAAGALRQRAIDLYLRRESTRALAAAEQAVAAAPGDAQSLLTEAAILQSLSRLDEAAQADRSAVAAAKTQGDQALLADALCTTGDLLAGLGKTEEARADLQGALAAAPRGWPRATECRGRLESLGARR